MYSGVVNNNIQTVFSQKKFILLTAVVSVYGNWFLEYSPLCYRTFMVIDFWSTHHSVTVPLICTDFKVCQCVKILYCCRKKLTAKMPFHMQYLMWLVSCLLFFFSTIWFSVFFAALWTCALRVSLDRIK